MKPDSNTTVAALLAHHPSTLHVFIARRMLCIGCPAQAYHTIHDAAALHGVDRDAILAEIHEAICSVEET